MRGGAYVAAAGMSARGALAERGVWLARIAFLVVLLLIFSRLWEAVAEEGAVAGIGTAAFLWYLLVTEWIVLSPPWLHTEIQEDVQRGDVAYRLARPVSYVGLKLAEGAGSTATRLALLGVGGTATAFLLTGSLPVDLRGLLLLLPLAALSVTLLLLFQVAIGLSTFWLQDAAPLFWIWQKLVFVFGGLLFPLDIYPAWLRGVAEWTPFSAMIYGCGRMALDPQPGAFAGTLVRLVLWGGILALLVWWLDRRALKVLSVNGG